MTVKTYTIQIDIDALTRARLETARTLCSLANQDLGIPTWSHAVAWLCQVVPLAELLRDQLDSAQTGVNYERTEPEPEPVNAGAAADSDPVPDDHQAGPNRRAGRPRRANADEVV